MVANSCLMARPCIGGFTADKACQMQQHAARLLQQYHRCTVSLPSCRNVAARASNAASAAASSTREGLLLDASIGPGLQLMEQQFSVAGHLLRMIAPAGTSMAEALSNAIL